MSSTASEEDVRGRTSKASRRAWFVLVAITLLNSAGMSVVFPVLPFVTLRFVPDEASLAIWVGVLESVNALCAFLVAPFLGALSDRIGRRPIVIIGAFGAALGYALFGIAGALWVLVLARVIQGLTAGDMPALFAYLADITPAEDRAKRFGLLGALSGIGFMVGPAVGGLLATVSLEAPVFATAAVAVLIGLLSIFVLPESLAEENRSPKLVVTGLHPFKAISDAFSRKSLRPLLIGFTLITVPFVFFSSNISVVALDAVGWGPTQIGLLLAAIGVLDIVVQGGLLGILLPRIGERGIVVAGVVGQAIGCLGIALAASVLPLPWVLAAAALVLASGQGGMTAALDGMMSGVVGADEQGWFAGSVSSLTSALQMISPLLAGWMYGALGHSSLYWVGFVMIVLAGVVFTRSVPSRTSAVAEAVGVRSAVS